MILFPSQSCDTPAPLPLYIFSGFGAIFIDLIRLNKVHRITSKSSANVCLGTLTLPLFEDESDGS